MVGGNPVDQCVWATGILPYIAADGARTLTTRIWHIVKSLWVQGVGQVQIDQARLYNCPKVIVIHFQDTVHAGKNDNYTTINGNSATTQTCSSATWYDRYVMVNCYLDDGRHIFSRGRQYYDVGGTAIDRCIVLIKHQIIECV